MTFVPTTLLAGFTSAQLSAVATVEVVGATPLVRELTPNEGPATGGTTVQVHLAGFPPIASIADLNITLGGISVASPALIYADTRCSFPSRVPPARPLCTRNVVYMYLYHREICCKRLSRYVSMRR